MIAAQAWGRIPPSEPLGCGVAGSTMMDGGGAPCEVLLEQPWLPVSISGCRLLAKSWFGGTEYHLLLTDLRCVWEERMESAAIQSRAQELNKRLRAPVKAFFSHLCEVVQPCLRGSGSGDDGCDTQMSLTRQEDGNISMRVKSELAGLPFCWEFHCTPAPVSMVCVQLVRPLLLMSQVLQLQVEELGGLLFRKDAEIQDYQENGATLSRERLQTEIFVEQTYKEDFIAKTLPQVCSAQQDNLRFDDDLQHLYMAVVTHGEGRKRKRSETCIAEDEQPDAEELTLTPPPGGGEMSRETKQCQKDQEDSAGAKMADRPEEQQPHPVVADPAERPSSRPKKKKGVGLFR
ncbi:hypothetical protein LDENG_00035200 [Lucifuga dentata]|nr:hypothetical protein LDENG_00035200 [Lucifuga dentata]